MKTNKIKNILLACATGVLLSTGLSSCQDWLKEETYDFTQPDDIEDSDAGATQWLIGCYSRLSTLFNGNTFPMVWLYDEDYLTGPSWHSARSAPVTSRTTATSTACGRGFTS